MNLQACCHLHLPESLSTYVMMMYFILVWNLTKAVRLQRCSVMIFFSAPLNNCTWQILDADNGKRLESSTGRIATRDIVQFVPMREVQGEEQSASCQPQLSHFRNRTVTISNTISSQTILCPCAQVGRSPSYNLFWRNCPVSSCSTCALGGSSHSSSRLRGLLQRPFTLLSSDQKKTCRALNELVLLPQLWIPLASVA